MKKNYKAYIKNLHNTLKSICEDYGVLLMGLTGGIATGKSTVSAMFKNLGAVIIDFDLLAKSVVEPGRKSWKLIAEHFGDRVMNKDNSINRKKLSDIVFNDYLEKEKLESFTHPYIWDEYILNVKEIILKDDNSIILAVIPLLIEGNMQGLFSKNIVVYAPPDLQVKRLMERDKISREKAKKIMSAQIPIDDKISYGEFIIENDGHPDKTKERVKSVWEEILRIQEEKRHLLSKK